VKAILRKDAYIMIAGLLQLSNDVIQLPGEHLGCYQVQMPKYKDFPYNCGTTPNYCEKNDDGTYKYPTEANKLRYPTNFLDNTALYFTPLLGTVPITTPLVMKFIDSKNRCALTDRRTSYPIWRPDAYKLCVA